MSARRAAREGLAAHPRVRASRIEHAPVVGRYGGVLATTFIPWKMRGRPASSMRWRVDGSTSTRAAQSVVATRCATRSALLMAPCRMHATS